MAEVKWIKINVDMFDDEKIKIIQSMPDGDALLVVWIKLITLAGKTNDGGYIYIAENMPYTDEMLSVIMNKPLNTIRLALDTFTKLGMIEIDVRGIYLVNFDKHQSLDRMEKIKEQNRIRKQRQREREKQLKLSENSISHVTGHAEVTSSHVTDIDIDKDIYIDINKNILSKEQLEKEFEEIWSMYPKKQGKSNALKSYIKARKNGVDKERIWNGLGSYISYIKSNGTATQYIKNGSTWFNQECWNDDYTIVKKQEGVKKDDGIKYADGSIYANLEC